MQCDTIRLSVIIPVYNVEAYVEACIQSVLGQSFRNFEVILVDDGSTDRSGGMCDRFAETDTRIRVIHKENGGLSSARNAAIHEAKGDYILFLDSDDAWTGSNFLSDVCGRLKQTNADVLSFNFRKVYDGHTVAPYFPQQGVDAGDFSAVSKNLWIACAWNKAIRRPLFENNDLYFVEGITSEDIDWCVRLALAAEKFDYLDLCGVDYRQRQGSISNAMTVKKADCLRQNILCSQKLAQDAGGEKERLLQTYLAYQVGTLLQAISQLEGKEERRNLMNESKPLLPLLANSENGKIRLLHWVNKLAGIHGCVALLRLRNRLR